MPSRFYYLKLENNDFMIFFLSCIYLRHAVWWFHVNFFLTLTVVQITVVSIFSFFALDIVLHFCEIKDDTCLIFIPLFAYEIQEETEKYYFWGLSIIIKLIDLLKVERYSYRMFIIRCLVMRQLSYLKLMLKNKKETEFWKSKDFLTVVFKITAIYS